MLTLNDKYGSTRKRKQKKLFLLESINLKWMVFGLLACLMLLLMKSQMAYKPMKSIIENIKDTVEIAKIIKPVYNFKAN